MTLLPEGVGAFAAAAVIFASFFTSLLTAAFGLGGGVALLALMGLLLPPVAIIPVHGVAQLGANASRFLFLRRHTNWTIIKWFSLGCLIGACVGAIVFVALPAGVLRIGVGAFVLWTLWGPMPKKFAPRATSFFATGAVGSFLSMFFGATGPLAAAMLGAAKLDRLQTVSTHAAAMVVQHGIKSAAFVGIGFAFQEWVFVIMAIVVAGAFGAWAGTQLLKKMPEVTFNRGFKVILTALAVYLLYLGVFGIFRTD
jgi:uncharacterized membrane protein YfcA